LGKLSIVEEAGWGNKQIRMANLACVGSHSINGVAALHTELLQKDTLKEFAMLWQEKFYNKTNGVTPAPVDFIEQSPIIGTIYRKNRR
jgi:starch phosphorylase